MATTLAAVMVEALDVRALGRFWAGALDWRLAESDESVEARVAVQPLEPGGVGLVFVPSARPKAGKNRMHLDLAGGSDQVGQVGRLLDLGAVRADIGQGRVPWDVLVDPEGNEFCVLPGAADGGGPLAAVCLDAADPAGQGRFWGAAIGWSIADRGDWGVKLRSPDGTGPALVMGPPVAPKSGANRLRPEVALGPGDDLGAQVGRLLEAGASRLDAGCVLADPEGNEFHLVRQTLS